MASPKLKYLSNPFPLDGTQSASPWPIFYWGPVLYRGEPIRGLGDWMDRDFSTRADNINSTYPGDILGWNTESWGPQSDQQTFVEQLQSYGHLVYERVNVLRMPMLQTDSFFEGRWPHHVLSWASPWGSRFAGRNLFLRYHDSDTARPEYVVWAKAITGEVGEHIDYLLDWAAMRRRDLMWLAAFWRLRSRHAVNGLILEDCYPFYRAALGRTVGSAWASPKFVPVSQLEHMGEEGWYLNETEFRNQWHDNLRIFMRMVGIEQGRGFVTGAWGTGQSSERPGPARAEKATGWDGRGFDPDLDGFSGQAGEWLLLGAEGAVERFSPGGVDLGLPQLYLDADEKALYNPNDTTGAAYNAGVFQQEVWKRWQERPGSVLAPNYKEWVEDAPGWTPSMATMISNWIAAGGIFTVDTAGAGVPANAEKVAGDPTSSAGAALAARNDALTGDSDTVTWDLYIGKESPPDTLLAADLAYPVFDYTGNTWQPGVRPSTKLAYDTTYYWRAVAKDATGLYTEGPIWEMRTVPVRWVELEESPGGSSSGGSNGGEPNQSVNVPLAIGQLQASQGHLSTVLGMSEITPEAQQRIQLAHSHNLSALDNLEIDVDPPPFPPPPPVTPPPSPHPELPPLPSVAPACWHLYHVLPGEGPWRDWCVSPYGTQVGVDQEGWLMKGMQAVKPLWPSWSVDEIFTVRFDWGHLEASGGEQTVFAASNYGAGFVPSFPLSSWGEMSNPPPTMLDLFNCSLECALINPTQNGVELRIIQRIENSSKQESFTSTLEEGVITAGVGVTIRLHIVNDGRFLRGLVQYSDDLGDTWGPMHTFEFRQLVGEDERIPSLQAFQWLWAGPFGKYKGPVGYTLNQIPGGN